MLSSRCPYIDDICVINVKFFDRLIHRIYPESLIADKSSNDSVVTELDVLIRVRNNCCSTNVYHRVDYFSFSVVLYMFPSRNIPIKMGYNVFSSQLIRFARICSVKDDFVVRAKKMYSIMLESSYWAKTLIRSCENVFRCHCNLLFKFGFHLNRFLSHWKLCETIIKISKKKTLRYTFVLKQLFQTLTNTSRYGTTLSSLLLLSAIRLSG